MAPSARARVALSRTDRRARRRARAQPCRVSSATAGQPSPAGVLRGSREPVTNRSTALDRGESEAQLRGEHAALPEREAIVAGANIARQLPPEGPRIDVAVPALGHRDRAAASLVTSSHVVRRSNRPRARCVADVGLRRRTSARRRWRGRAVAWLAPCRAWPRRRRRLSRRSRPRSAAAERTLSAPPPPSGWQGSAHGTPLVARCRPSSPGWSPMPRLSTPHWGGSAR